MERVHLEQYETALQQGEKKMSIQTFEGYLKEPQSLTFEKMNSIHQKMKREIGRDEKARELYEDLLEVAARYSNIRAAWVRMSSDERAEKDSYRTSTHDSLIIHLNMLARYLKKQGYPADWRDEIAIEEEGYDRKAIGDFGCYLAFVSAIGAR